MANGLDYKIRKLEIAYAIADKTVGRGASESEEQEKYLNGLRRGAQGGCQDDRRGNGKHG